MKLFMAYHEHDVSLHAAIKVRITKDIGDKTVSKIIDCTVGRLIFNESIPQNLGYVDRTNSDKQFDLEIAFLVGKKKQLSNIIERCIRIHGTTTQPRKCLIKSRLSDLNIQHRHLLPLPFATLRYLRRKRIFLQRLTRKIDVITKQYDYGYISSEEKSKKVIDVWNKATDDVYNCTENRT